MTYNVSSVMVNSTIPYRTIPLPRKHPAGESEDKKLCRKMLHIICTILL